MKKYLTAEQEATLAEAALAGDVEARNVVVLNMHRLIWREAIYWKRKCFSTVEDEDLTQIGILAVLDHFDMYNVNLGRFSTYFLIVARRAMHAHITQNSTDIRVPCSSARLAAKDAGRAKCVKRVKDVERAQRVMSLDTVLYEDNTELGSKVIDTKAADPADIIAAAERDVNAQKAMLKLSETNYKLWYIVTMRYNGKNLKEVGDKLELSRERVRQLQRDAEALLREYAHA